jgi:hypothetical protein
MNRKLIRKLHKSNPFILQTNHYRNVSINQIVIVAEVEKIVEVLGGDTALVKVRKIDDDVHIKGVKVEVGIVVENVVGNIVGNVVGNVEGIKVIDIVEVGVKKGEGRRNAEDARKLLVEVEKEKI